MANVRSLLLIGALVLTVAASVLDWPGQTETDAAGTAPTRAQRAPKANVNDAQPAKQITASAPGAARMHHTRANAFASTSWLPPPPKAVVPPPPPPPRAPPLPFVYLGKMQDANAITVFASQGTRNHVLHSGDTLPNYRVDSITSTDMTFVYLPLNEKQRLIFGSAN